jgi:hypothetical protein
LDNLNFQRRGLDAIEIVNYTEAEKRVQFVVAAIVMSTLTRGDAPRYDSEKRASGQTRSQEFSFLSVHQFVLSFSATEQPTRELR